MKQRLFLGGLALAAALNASCGNVVRQGKAPVFLVVDLLQGQRGAVDPEDPSGVLLSDVLTLVTSPEPCTPESPCPTVFDDFGRVSLRTALKDVNTPTGPSTNTDVTITRYRVVFRRADGRNTPGVDVPYGFDSAFTATIPGGGAVKDLSFELVRHNAKMEAPLVQLITSPTIISTIAEVTFYGRDLVGNEVSASASIGVNFGNFGDY
jgi:hypothetical protein